MPAVARRALRKGMEWEFENLTLPRELSKSLVTRMLVERAETGGWELARVQIKNDGVRRIVLRRRIIRQSTPRMYL